MKIIALLLVSFQSASVPIISTAPPLVAMPVTSQAVVARFTAGEAKCSGTVQQPRLSEEPLPAGFSRYTGSAFMRPEPKSFALSFDIDSAGRPTNIRNAEGLNSLYPIDARDLAPTLSLWRFDPGARRQGCRIRFDVSSQPVESADLTTLYRYLALQRPGIPGFSTAVGKAALARLAPAGSNCRAAPISSVREQHHPAFETIAPGAGGPSFSFLGFDIAADGTTQNVKVIHSGGNGELDRQSLAALAKWRFQPGERNGCLYSYYKWRTEPAPAPEPRRMEAYAPAKARCRNEPEWLEPLKPVYPAQFNRRSIEGWAVVGYDVAPWGATGNVKVLASEPSEHFGEQAVSSISRAKKAASTTGYTGCVQRVRFKMARLPGDPPAPVPAD